MHIDAEPRPRPAYRLPDPSDWSGRPRIALNRDIREPAVGFLDVLRRRRSCVSKRAVSSADLSSLLWHTMLLRERRAASRAFGTWESRTAPAAGGIHCIRLLCLALHSGGIAGLYEPDRHEIILLGEAAQDAAKDENRRSVSAICGASSGVTLQFAADVPRIEAAYENSETLIWRDAGALLMTVALVAEALDLAAMPLGRVGDSIVRTAGLDGSWRGAGAIHLSGVSHC